ncbi:hypothetical protein PO909_027638 [Leuciscus waleckii]
MQHLLHPQIPDLFKKLIFSQYLDFFAPSDSRCSKSCISDKYCPPNKPYINGKLIYSAFR